MEALFLMHRYNVDPRRVKELRDSRLIQEDQNAIANCPTRPIYTNFGPGIYSHYDDSSAITPIPYPRHHKFDGGEDERSYKADKNAE